MLSGISLLKNMNELVSAISTAAVAFSATNIDDIIILLLFFSQISATFRPQNIVVGQYLGFTILLILSFLVFLED